MPHAKENLHDADEGYSAKRKRSAHAFGAEHDELAAQLASIGVTAPCPRANGDMAAEPRFVVADPLTCRAKAHRLAKDGEARRALVGGLSALWDAPGEWLRACLSPARSPQGQVSESVAKVLLRAEALQPDLADALLERVAAVAADAGFDADAPIAESEPRLILSHLRWLEVIAEPAAMVRKLLEVLEACPPALQREMVALAPEICEDAQHELVVDTFEELMTQDSSHVLPVLHAISSLHLAPDLADRAFRLLAGALPSADEADLPALVRTLLQGAPADAARDAVRELRRHVAVVARGGGGAAHEPQLVDALTSAVRFRRELAAAALAELEDAEALAPLDVWLLCALHAGGSTTAARKQAERHFVRHAAGGALSRSTVQTAIAGHGAAIRGTQRSLLAFASACVRAAHSSLAREVGREAYVATYVELCASAAASGGAALGMAGQQELLGSLLSHGGSGVPSEVDEALASLSALAEREAEALRPHTALLGTQLDHLDSLTLPQTRQLFTVFGRLAAGPSGTEPPGRRADELSILVRKLLSAVDPAYKERGIAAACALLEQIQDGEGGGDREEGGGAREAEELLGLMETSCARNWRCSAFMSSQLAAAVRAGRLSRAIVKALNKRAFDLMETHHLVERSKTDVEALSAVHGLRPALVLHTGADDDDGADAEEGEDKVAVDIWGGVLKALDSGNGGNPGQRHGAKEPTGDGDRGDGPPQAPAEAAAGDAGGGGVRVLCAHMDVLAETEVQLNGSLGEVDELVACPLLLFQPEAALPAARLAELSPEAADLACACLLHACNWVRAVVAVFARELARQTAPEVDEAARVVARLEQLAALEVALERCAARAPNFVPAELFRYGGTVAVAGAGASKKRGRSVGKRGKAEVRPGGVSGADAETDVEVGVDGADEDADADAEPDAGEDDEPGLASPSKADAEATAKGPPKASRAQADAASGGRKGTQAGASKAPRVQARVRAAAARRGPRGTAAEAAANGLPTGSVYDWPTKPHLTRLAPVLRPLGAHVSFIASLPTMRDCNTLGDTLEDDQGNTVTALELSPPALHLVLRATHSALATAIGADAAAPGRGPGAAAGFGRSAAGGAAADMDTGAGVAAGEGCLAAEATVAATVRGVSSFPHYLASLVVTVEAGEEPDDAAAAETVLVPGLDADEEDGAGGGGAGRTAPAHRAPAATSGVFADPGKASCLDEVPRVLHVSYAVPCICLMLRMVRLILASDRLRIPDSPARCHVVAVLRAFADAADAAPERTATAAAAQDDLAVFADGAATYFEALLPSLPTGTAAVDLVEVLVALSNLPATRHPLRAQLRHRAADAATLALQRSWCKDQAKPKGGQVTRLFAVSLDLAQDPRAILNEWATVVFPKLVERTTGNCDGEGYVAEQPLLSTRTMHLFVRPLEEQLDAALKRVVLPADPAKDPTATGATVQELREAMCLFAGLLLPSKTLGSSGPFLSHMLRMSRRFLETVNKVCMPFFVTAFAHAEHRESIAGVLRELQQTTRLLQSHCAESKALRAVGALAQQPHVKRQLEQLVFHVRHMLAENKCTAAFWMGNLKHKTPAGEVVPSQIPDGLGRPAKAKGKVRGPKRQRPENDGDADDVRAARVEDVDSCAKDDDDEPRGEDCEHSTEEGEDSEEEADDGEEEDDEESADDGDVC